MKIVVVEDEIRIREGICRLVQKMFPDLELSGSAENGQEGLWCIERTEPDIVITDIKMPVMDGLEMLSRAQAGGYHPKVIVLTAYSEFSYAQQAVKLGVNDYLIKPVVVQEFAQTMRKVQNMCAREQTRPPEIMGSLENIVSGILHGISALDEGMYRYLYQKFGIQKDMPVIELVLYLGNCFENERERVRRELNQQIAQKQGIKYCMVDLEYDRTLFVFVYGYSSRLEVERWYQNSILFQRRDFRNRQISHGMTEVMGIEHIREGYQQLVPYMDWNMVLGDDVLISYPKIQKIQTNICVYPVEIENRMKVAVCTGENADLRNITERFHQYFADGTVYSPKEMKESYVRFLWALINIAKEVGSIAYKELGQQDLLDRIMSAKTRQELWNVCEELLGRIGAKPEKTDALSLPVKKAQSMIHEFYAEGITLGEIADKLNITQEYLGNQFHKELGENFSAYIRNYRLGKAKELLLGTQLKQYEIAEKVGYTDAKYFARVFREYVGMSPAEYRKANR